MKLKRLRTTNKIEDGIEQKFSDLNWTLKSFLDSNYTSNKLYLVYKCNNKLRKLVLDMIGFYLFNIEVYNSNILSTKSV